VGIRGLRDPYLICGSLAGGAKVVGAVGSNGNTKTVQCIVGGHSVVPRDGYNITAVTSPLEHTTLGVRNGHEFGAGYPSEGRPGTQKRDHFLIRR
jgi:hypothetical protein